MKKLLTKNDKGYWWLLFVSHILLSIIVLTTVSYFGYQLFESQGLWIFVVTFILLLIILAVDFVYTYQKTKKIK